VASAFAGEFCLTGLRAAPRSQIGILITRCIGQLEFPPLTSFFSVTLNLVYPVLHRLGVVGYSMPRVPELSLLLAKIASRRTFLHQKTLIFA
jgi:hypothetical protein